MATPKEDCTVIISQNPVCGGGSSYPARFWLSPRPLPLFLETCLSCRRGLRGEQKPACSGAQCLLSRPCVAPGAKGGHILLPLGHNQCHRQEMRGNYFFPPLLRPSPAILLFFTQEPFKMLVTLITAQYRLTTASF